MAIIISKNGKNAKKVERSTFEKEDYLQKYIYDNPESIPLYDIKEDIRLLILSREFSTKSGSIDALGIDKEGEIYLVETKLYKNPDKRLVVAQVLDYGASLWRFYNNFDEFIRVIDNEVNNKFGVSFNQRIKEFFDIGDEEIDTLIENLKKNLNEGNFKFVVLMDKLHSQLKDLVIFINKNSRFDIFAVEMEYYKHEDYEIMIPKLFGAEVKKDIGVSSSRSGRQWDESSFFSEAEKMLGEDEVEILKDLYNFASTRGTVIWGKGMSATLNMRLKSSEFQRSIFTTFSKGRTWIGIGSISQFFGIEMGKWLANEIKRIGVEISENKDLKHTYPEFNIVELTHEKIEIFKEIIDTFCQKVEKIS
jgi:hypothetical protein